MIQLSDEAVAQHLAWPALNAAIEAMVLSAAVAPPRHSYPLQGRRGDEGRLLIMPAWADDDVVGIKLVTVWPGNATLGLPSHGASYILLDARSGEVRATLAAEALTHRRTAAVSTLAASRLLPDTAERLLVVGTGPVAEQLVRAHAASGRFSVITLSGRAPDKVAALAAALGDIAVPCEIAHNLESAVRDADMVVGATSATSPWLRGDWLRPNAHVDLIGGFTPDMRESDDALMSRADAIWVDVLAAVDESGDLIQPINAGVIDRAAIRGDFAALLARQAPRGPGITLFKSVGTAIADLAAARLILST